MPSGPGASLTPSVRYPSDDLTPAERARLAPHFTDLDGPVFALVNLPETVKGALFARYSRYPGHAAAAVPRRVRATRVPEGGAVGRPRGRARGAALRAHLRRLRRRLGGAARRRPRRLRVGLERADQGPAAAAARRLPRAVDALHRLRRADAGRRLPLLPRRRARARVRARRWTRCSTPTRRRCRACARGSTRRSRAPTGESEAARARAVNAKALDLLRGLLPAASLSHMGIYATGQAYEQLILHLIGHPLPEARALRRADPRGDQGGHAELRRARRAPRPRRRLGRATSRERRAAGRALGRAARARRTPTRPTRARRSR